MKLPAPNRIAVYLAALAALAGGLAPIVANLDLSSTIGILGGLVAIVAVVQKFLAGWQQFEAATYQHNLMQKEIEFRTQAAGPPPLTETKPASKAASLKLPR